MLWSLMLCISTIGLVAQAPAARFVSVTIKAAAPDARSGGGRMLPDGTEILINQTLQSLLLLASPAPVRQAKNVPDWISHDRFDITLTPPSEATREQRAEMIRTMFADRMKLVGHVEEQEMTTYALVIGTADKSLGPNLKPSAGTCRWPLSGPPVPADPTQCFSRMGYGYIDGRGAPLTLLARSLSRLAGAEVIDRTGLTGNYDFVLRFVGKNGVNANALPFAQALQQQLGLTLYPEESKQPVFVIDHIEPPIVDE